MCLCHTCNKSAIAFCHRCQNMENLEKDKHTLLKSYASLPPQKTIFYRYDTFIERSCEQLKIAKRQQMNVEIIFLNFGTDQGTVS